MEYSLTYRIRYRILILFVLILILMEYSLTHNFCHPYGNRFRLNPYSNGILSDVFKTRSL